MGPFARAIDLGERKSPFNASDLRTTLVEPLTDARTPLVDFFSILHRRLVANKLGRFLGLKTLREAY